MKLADAIRRPWDWQVASWRAAYPGQVEPEFAEGEYRASAYVGPCPCREELPHLLRVREAADRSLTYDCAAGAATGELKAIFSKLAAEHVPLEDASTTGQATAPAPVEVPPVDRLLDDVEAYVRRYVVLSPAQVVAVALWVIHTHAFGAAETTPYLNVTSVEKESGKTRLLEALEPIVARPWLTGRITAAVLVRKVDAERPTLLLDESDAAFKGEKEYAEALRGLLNTGYRVTGKSTICVGQGATINYKDFSTFCSKAIAGIGQLPDTVASRSITVALKRRAADEPIEPFRIRAVRARADDLRARLEAWTAAHVEALAGKEPDIPSELGDRTADCWEPLLAIADLAGRDWPTRARAAAVELAGCSAAEDESLGVRLLADVRAAFANEANVFTAALLEALNGFEESPWGGWHHGGGLTPRDLAKRLRPFGIRSRTVRVGEDTGKGFKREQFDDAWARYLPVPPSPEKGSHPSHGSQVGPHAVRDVTDVTDVTDFEGTGGGTNGWTPKAADAFIARAKENFPGSYELPPESHS